MNSSASRIALAFVASQILLGCSGGSDNRPSGTLVAPQSREEVPAGEAGSDGTQKSPPVNAPTSGNNSPVVDDPDEEPEPCLPAVSTEPVPARSVAMFGDGQQSERVIYSPDLFEAFDNLCGSCHVAQGLGAFQVRDYLHLKEDTDKFQKSIVQTMETSSKEDVMPPYDQTKVVGTDRKPGDPVVELTEWFKAYFEAGSPVDWFVLPVVPRADETSVSYVLPERVGMRLTNIGNCMPSKRGMRTNTSAMDRLDAVFAQAKELPKYLDQTDLTTFDSEALASEGVVSFAPAYTLFSDHARKMRHVRVPRGRSIVFDPARQAFDIPENTRFYKTFFKKVIERDGSERYRKIETRLIVTRQDGKDSPDGSHTTHALFGAYAWDEKETTAQLVTDPLRNGKPFRDRVVTYITDEAKAEEALANSQAVDRLQALLGTGATRSWAIPGSERCIQCHMGSPSRDFVLGFMPVQINRRPTGEGGTYEPTSDDELGQLQRLIDLGTVTGVKSGADILPLEKSQGDRKPRNEYELLAQGYMLGNCAGCHNPRGFPSVRNPVLRNLLNFLPDARDGGVFQFPLERTSPRIKRGYDQSVDIPYITPSLIDLEPEIKVVLNANPGAEYADKFTKGVVKGAAEKTTFYMAAPWRSLIYRNVDAPYLYAEDYAMYPHMPMNVAGFDTRAPRIMADWMVSIPAKLNSGAAPDIAKFERYAKGQVYVEVKPSDPNYAAEVRNATQRLDHYHKSGRAPYHYFPEFPDHKATYFDGVRYRDYAPHDQDTILHPEPPQPGKAATPVFVPDDACGLPSMCEELRSNNGQPEDDLLHYWGLNPDKVPDSPNWVRTDNTDSPGSWYPRRSDWADVIVAPKPEQVTVLSTVYRGPEICKSETGFPENDSCVLLCDPMGPPPQPGVTCKPADSDTVAKQKFALSELRFKTLTPAFREFAVAPQPFGLWKIKPECKFPNVRRVSDFGPEASWRWMRRTGARAPDPNAPVYTESVGGAVFKEICTNCHGKALDSRGIQADTLAQVTGGKSRVANFRDGLLGPREDPGRYRNLVFQPRAHKGLTADDWAGRYTAWMALGGTQSKIDPTILGLIANATVLGVKRGNPVAISDANMLAVAQSLCRETIGITAGTKGTEIDIPTGALAERPSLIDVHGDGELWRRLCAFHNARPIYVAALNDKGNPILHWRSFRSSVAYPTDGQLADHDKTVTGFTTDNQGPWCVIPPVTKAEQDGAAAVIAQRPDNKLPYCPEAWLQASKPMSDWEVERWATRGAINAGFAVFLYVDQLAKELKTGADGLSTKEPPPNYDECEALEPKP